MKINDLKDNQIVKYRLGFHGKNQIDWKNWTEGPIYVARRQFDFKGKGKGELLTLTPKNEGWAEYSQADYHGSGFFDCEEYCMEVEGMI